MNDQVQKNISFLEQQNEEHLKIAEEMLRAKEGACFAMDLFAGAVLKRSMSIISGFVMLIKAKNYICAAPLVRLQLDNLLRFSAAYIVEDPDKLATDVLKGIPIERLKDKRNKKMRDGYLVEELKKKYSWIERVYKNASGYIHFSEKHMSHLLSKDKSKEKNVVLISIGAENDAKDFPLYEATLAMINITDAVLRYIYGWVYKKKNANRRNKIPI
ncbi:MAG: hypothetical protein ABIK53_05600 [bacterium]